ncbi:MAG: hypothetical protein HY398_01745, partial [Candidatus Doudnabacteria bacterium]|nr:hypothetical protein [Candidatus Doudnabacteria bacterium]
MRQKQKFKSIKKFIAVLAGIFGLLFVLSLLVLQKQEAQATTGVPEIISYQGRLTDSSGSLLTGTYYFKFSIWTNATVGSGTKLWPSSSTGATTTLTVTEGVFNVSIGSDTDALTYNFNDNDTVYLQVKVSSNNSTYETLSPRQQITSSGFAINASTVGGFSASQTAAAGEIPVINSSGVLALPGGLTFNAATTTDSLYIGGLTQLSGATASSTGLVFGGDVNIFRSAANTLNFQSSSTTNAGSLVIDTETLVVNANEGRVGIGTAVPSTTLGVVGTTRLVGATAILGGAL